MANKPIQANTHKISADVIFNESLVPQGAISVSLTTKNEIDFTLINSNKAFNKLAKLGNSTAISANKAFAFLEGFNSKPLTQFYLANKTNKVEFIYQGNKAAYKLTLIKQSDAIILFSVSDITDLQSARSELNEKKRQLKESQEIASLGYWVENHQSKKHFWSDQIFKILDVEAQNIEPSFSSYLSFVLPDDRQRVEEEFKSALKNKVGYEITHCLQLENGQIKHVNLRSYTNYNQLGAPEQSVGIIQDITSSEITKTELVNSEAKFRSVFDFAPMAIVLVNDNFAPVFCNSQFSQLIGYSIDEIYERNLKDFTYSDDYENNHLQYKRLFSGEISSFSLAKRYVCKNGKVLWAKVIVSAIKNAYSPNKMAIAMVQDISAEKEATEALVKSEYQYRTLIDNASDGVGLFDYNFKPIIYNEQLYKMLGYTLAEYLKFDHNKYELFHPDDVPAAHKAVSDIRKGKKSRIENRMRNNDGSYSFFSINYIPVTHENKPAILIFRRNITKRKLAEQQNEEYRLFLETLMDNLPVSLFAKTTPDFRYLYWNSTIERVTGIPAEDAIGKNDFELMQFKQLAEQYYKEDEKLLKSGRKLESEHEFTNSLGEVKEFKTIKTIHQSNTGSPLILGISVDITKLKQAEKQIEQSTQMLKEAQKIAKLGYWEYDVQKDLFFDNMENRQILGTESLPYFINYTQFKELLHISDQSRVEHAFKKCIQNKTIGEGIIKVMHNGSEFKHVSIKYKPIEDDKGKVVKLRGTCLDITRIRKSEMALRESENRLKQAEHIAKVGYWDYDFDKKETKFSDEILKILEIDSLDTRLSLNDFFDSVHGDDKLRVTAQFQKSKLSNQPFDIGFKIVSKNRNIKYIKAIGTFVKNGEGSILRSIGTIQDVSDQKQNEIAVEKIAHQLQDIQRVSKIGFIEQATNSNEVTFSNTLCDVLGFQSENCISSINDFNSLIHPDDRETILKTIDKSIKVKQSYNIQYRLLHENGKTIFVNELCSILNNKNSITRIIQDITAYKEQKIELDKVSEIQEIAVLGTWEYAIKKQEYKFDKSFLAVFSNSNIKTLNLIDFIHDDDKHSIEKTIAASISVKENFTINYRIYMPDGKIKYIQNFCSFQESTKGEGIIYGIMRDVSDYRNTLNKLNDRVELFKAITENSLLGIVIYQNGQRVYSNERWAEMVGVKLQDLNYGLNLEEIYQPETIELIKELFNSWEDYNLSEYSNKLSIKPINAPEFAAEVFVRKIQYLGKEAMIILALPGRDEGL